MPTAPASRRTPPSTRLWPALLLVVLPFVTLIALQAYDLLNPGVGRSRQLVSHTQEVITTAQALKSALQDAQRQQRGYLLTGASSYLRPYQAETQSALIHIANLQRLVSDNPDQQQRMSDLARRIDLKLGIMRSEVAVYEQNGLSAAQRLLRDNAETDAIQPIGRAIDSIVATEDELLTQRLAREAAEEHAADRIALASGMLAFALMIIGVTLATRSLRNERRLKLEVDERAREVGDANRRLEEKNAELARANEIAADATERANRANVAKGRFLATASHDLRQPLQTLALLNGVLRRRVSDPDAAEALEQQEQAVGSVSRLLNALLDISKLESGAIKPKRVDFAVLPLFDVVRREFGTIAANKGLELVVEPCAENVHSDPVLVEQIVRNLLSNAIKYTKTGSVQLRCVGAESCVRIEVTDSGVGIAPDQIPYITDEFYQIGVSPTGARDGYGLGLNIVQRLVQLLDLKLDVRSVVGKGSVFAVILPRAEAPVVKRIEPAPAAARDSGPSHAHIMLVEDDRSVRSATSMLLKAAGFTVIAVGTRAEALEKLRELDRLDLLITDLHLGNNETGIDVLASIREALGVPVKAIVVTGDTSSGIQNLSSDPNLRVASKPVNADELLSLMRGLLASQDVTPPESILRQA